MGAVSVRHEGGTAFMAQCRGHAVRIDQPASNHGADSGMTPPELFASALAGCIGHYVANYCVKAGIPSDGLSVDCSWNTVERPYRIGDMAVSVQLPNLPDNCLAAVERVAASCMLHATLEHPPHMALTINK